MVKDDVIIMDATALFSGLNAMKSASMPADMSECTSTVAMFDGCRSLEAIDFRGRNVAKVTSMRYMFRCCSALRWCYISDMNTKNVESMRYMFQECRSLVNVDLTNFDTRKLNNVAGMFNACSSMTSIDISSFILPQGIDYDVEWMFAGCSSVKRINFGNNVIRQNDQLFDPIIPTSAPYTGKWVCEADPSIVRTTAELIADYPSERTPVGTYVWQVVPSAAVVEFDANGGTTRAEKIIQTGTTSTITLPDKSSSTLNDHILIGWNTERDGSGQECPAGSEYVPVLGRNVILYARWLPIQEAGALRYVIEGDDNLDRQGIYEDPSENENEGYFAVGATVSVTNIVPKRQVHTFLGWSDVPVDDIDYLADDKAQEFLDNEHHITSFMMPEDGKTLYAVWQQAYPDRIINGDFEYPEMKYFTPGWEHRWVGISIVSGRWEQNRGDTGLLADTVPNFDPRLYAWRSTFNFELPVSDQPGITEIQREIDTDNQYADLAYGEQNSDVYQDIITVPGAVYKWKIKQCSNRTDFNDILNVEIGSSSAQSPQDGWRTTQNVAKLGALGSVGKDMSTTVIVGGNFNHKDQWEQYEGSYTVPDGQWVTRFLFKMANNNGSAVGCLVDDIEFSISYALTYDLNNGTSETIYEDPKTENCQGYHCEGDEVKLFGNSDVKAPTGLTFLGWSRDETSIITNSMSKEEVTAICDDIVDSTFVMPAENVTLHAVYMETPEVQIGKNGEGTVKGPSIVVSDGSWIPRYEYDITPDSGSAIAEITVDGKPLDGFPVEEGETYRLILDDIVGKHEVQVTFQYQLLDVPGTGGTGTVGTITILITAGTLAIGAGMILGARMRNRRSKMHVLSSQAQQYADAD